MVSDYSFGIFKIVYDIYQGRIQDLWLGGGVSRRGVWGTLLGPQRVEGRALVGGPVGLSPPEALGV